MSKKEQETYVKAIHFPVAHVDEDTLNVLKNCWLHSSMLANWAVQQYHKYDVVRTPDMESLPPMSNDLDLYSLFTGMKKQPQGTKRGIGEKIGEGYPGKDFFNGATSSVTCIFQRVRSNWMKQRKEVIWDMQRNYQTFDRVQPWPVHNDGWGMLKGLSGLGIGYTDDQELYPYIDVKLPSCIERKPYLVRLNLRGGHEFARQLATFKDIVSSKIPKGELLIIPQRCSESRHRFTFRMNSATYFIKVAISVKVPVREKTGDRTLVLSTDPNSFWVAELDGRRTWIMNSDHLKQTEYRHQQMIAAHDRHNNMIRRMSQDGKAERRTGSNRVEAHLPKLQKMCHKDRNRMNSVVKEKAKNLINYACRQGVKEILYLDRDTGFLGKFPWCQLHDRIAQLCKENSIDFYSESGMKRGRVKVAIPRTGDIDLELSGNKEEDDKAIRIARIKEVAVRKLIAAKNRKKSHPEVVV